MPLVFTPMLLVLMLVLGISPGRTISVSPLAAVAVRAGDHRLCRAGV
jgi:hypothetical protein